MTTSRCLYGVNLPVILDAYNHDLAPNERYREWGCEFAPLWLFRYLAQCQALGFGAVRLWLCEDGEGLITEGGAPVGVASELLEAIAVAQEGARLLGLKLYWTLLDGNAWHRNGDELTGRIFSDPAEARRFAEVVAAPIVERLDPKLTFAVEVVNEPESLSAEVLGEGGLPWPSIAESLREIRAVIHRDLPSVPVTAGSQAVFLPGLFEGAAEAPVDAVDLHVYHPDGGLPARGDLPVDIGGLPLLAGECGLSHRGEPGRSGYLLHYLYNARELNYRAAFLWKLEGEEHLVRREPVPEAPETWRFHRTAVGSDVEELLQGGGLDERTPH